MSIRRPPLVLFAARLACFLAIFFAVIPAPSLAASQAAAQDADAPDGALIKSAQVSGLDADRLSPGLRERINALTGTALNRDRLRELANRIEDEQPEYVAAVRSISTPDGGAQVVFLVARISDDRDLEKNINARYTIDSVTIEGIRETLVSQGLRDSLQALVGQRLDNDEADRLMAQLRSELSGYEIRRTLSRGDERGHMRVVFRVRRSEEMRWLHFEPVPSKLVYHSDQGWSGLLSFNAPARDYRVDVHAAFGDDDVLIEEYSGFGFRFDMRNVGTERLGLGLALSRYHESWEDTTFSALAADPSIPEAYRARATVEPTISLALTPKVRVNGGLSVNQLESWSNSPATQMASAFTASIGFGQDWFVPAKGPQRVSASVEVRSAAAALNSDLTYRRYFGAASYSYRRDHNMVVINGTAGRITGNAPLFERFSIGNSSTLRGWNKFDITPAGGDHLAYGSIEYRYREVGLFVDGGSAWDRTTDKRLRLSTGISVYSDGYFATLGIPLNADRLNVVFTTGVRLGWGYSR